MEYSKENYYVIEESALANLLKNDYKLSCLESYGVDNWDKYSEALAGEESGNNYWKYAERSDHEIAKECVEFDPDVMLPEEYLDKILEDCENRIHG